MSSHIHTSVPKWEQWVVITGVKVISLNTVLSAEWEYPLVEIQMEEGSSKSFELLSHYQCYMAALAPERLWCASGTPVLSYSIQPVSFKYISRTLFALYSLSRETRQNVQKNRSPRHRHSQKTEKGNTKASVRLTVVGNSHISKRGAH